MPVNDIYCEFAAGGYDGTYDLEFYFLGELFCYDNYSETWATATYTNLSNFHPEFQIIDKPGCADRFYAFCTQKNFNKNQDDELKYIEIYVNNGTPQIESITNIYEGMPVDCYLSFAITPEINNERYLYVASRDPGSYQGSLKMWTISSSGVSASFTTVMDETYTGFSYNDFSAYNLELKENANNEVTVAWISNSSGSNQKLFIVDDGVPDVLDINAINSSNIGRISGIEFSTYDDDIIYASTFNNGILKINYYTGIIIEDMTTSDYYGRTYLQTAPDGHIYGVSNDGHTLSRINMITEDFEENILSFPYTEVYTYETLNNNHHYILPENERKIDTLSASIELVHVCPGDSTGSATVTASGGIPDYTYTWYYWDAVEEEWVELTGITSNYTGQILWEGQYKCEIEDQIGNKITLEFEITVDPDLFDFDDMITVNDDEEWINYDYTYQKGIRVKKGSELKIINSHLQFGRFARIIVEDSARLIVESSVLTYYVDCYRKWQGIEVLGLDYQHQYTYGGGCYQGYVELKNNSEVSYAEVGIATYKSHLDPETFDKIVEWDSAGGIIKSQNTNFINNTKSIHFIPYDNFLPPGYTDTRMDNLSKFRLDTFDINPDNIGYRRFYKHVDLHGVDGINFDGCCFINSATTHVSEWNIGIAAYGAGFDVAAVCTQQISPCPPQYQKKSSFNGFYWAIGTYESSEHIHNFTVRDAEFDNNNTGVYDMGVNFPIILNSNFEVGYDNPGEGECDEPNGFGIDIHNAQYLAIEDNYCEKNSMADTGLYAGIRIDESHSDHDIIYRNTLYNLSFGNYAQGYNRLDDDDIYGLEYRCNYNSSNNIDFIVTGPELDVAQIRDYMGSRDTASGNTFSLNPLPEGHFKNEGEQVVSVYYYPLDPLQIPVYYTYYYVEPNSTNNENTCPDHYGGGGHIELTAGERQAKELEYSQNLYDYNGVQSLYESLVDGGSTPSELSDVNNAQPEDMWTLRAQLLGDSPHLSQEVLMATSDRTDVFPDDVLFDILAANPDELKEDTLLSYLENKQNPLPDYMIDLLRDLAIGNVTYKTLLKEDMAGYYAGKMQAAQDIIRSILYDSTLNMLDYRNWLDNMGSIEADKQIITSYLYEGDTSNALSLLNLLPGLYGLQGDELDNFNAYKTLVELQISWKSENKNIFSLDSLDIATLEAYENSASHSARTIARSILSYAYNKHYCDCMSANDSIYMKSQTGNYLGSVNAVFGPEISAEPNPADTWVAFNYKIPDEGSVGIIKIMDLYGKDIAQFRITGKQGQQVWDTRWIKPGIYLYTLVSEGLSKSGKIIVK